MPKNEKPMIGIKAIRYLLIRARTLLLPFFFFGGVEGLEDLTKSTVYSQRAWPCLLTKSYSTTDRD